MAGIKQDEWFKQDYVPSKPEDEEDDVYIDDEAFSIHEVVYLLVTLISFFSFNFSLDVTQSYVLGNRLTKQ